MTAKQLANKIKRKFKGIISDIHEFRGELTLEVSDSSQISEVCRYAKEELGFDYLVDLCTIDNDDDTPRWTAVYPVSYTHLTLPTTPYV